MLDATGLRSDLAALLAGFAEEVGRPPTRRELAEVLSWSLPDADVFSADPTGSSIEVTGPDQASDVPEDRPISAVPELNDAVFGDATDLLIAAAQHLLSRSGSAPTLQRTIDEIAALLHHLGDDALADRSSSPVRFRIRPRPKQRPRPTVGDVIGIPVGDGNWAFGVVLARNRFGTALGLLRHRGPLRPPPTDVDMDSWPVYTDDSAVREGRWQIVGQDRELLDRFPSEPELYHRQWPDHPNPELGPHGSGETPDGTLRALSETEAVEIGLADGSYQQILSPATLEAMLTTGC